MQGVELLRVAFPEGSVSIQLQSDCLPRYAWLLEDAGLHAWLVDDALSDGYGVDALARHLAAWVLCGAEDWIDVQLGRR